MIVLKRNYSVSKGSIIRFLLSVMMLFASFFHMSGIGRFLFICIFVMNIYCAIKTRDNNALLIVYLFLLWSNYSIYLYFWTDKIQKYLMYKYFVTDNQVMSVAVYSLYIFNAVLFVLCSKIKRKVLEEKYEGESLKSIIVGDHSSKWMACLVIIVIILISLYSMSIRINRGYMPASPLYEYLYIFFIVSFYLSCGNKKIDAVISLLIVVNCIYVFFNGARISAIQFALVFFMRFIMHRIPKRLMFIGIFMAIIGLNAIGMWRGFTEFDLGYFIKSLKYLFSTGITLDTAYSAEASGMCIIKLIGDYSVLGRLRLFVIYVIYVFVGSKAFGVESNLAALAQESYHYATGGGVLPCFGLFYLGYFGVVLVAVLVGHYLKMLGEYQSETSGYKRCLAAFIFASCMRWYLYSPAPLLRGALLFSIVFFLTTKFRIKE